MTATYDNHRWKTPRVDDLYAPYHIGLTSVALGLFAIDNLTKRYGWRATVPHNCTPSILWFYNSVAGAGSGEAIRISFGKGLASNPRLPDPAAATIDWTLPAATALGWTSIDISSVATALRVGDVLHVSFTKVSGARSATFHAVRSRFPLQYTSRLDNLLQPLRDDLNVAMYTTDITAPTADPYAAQRGDNSSMHPIWWMQCADGEGFGNPYDSIEEVKIYGADGGANAWAISFTVPRRIDANFLAINVRGSGSGGTQPTDHLYVTIKDASGAIVYGPSTFLSKTAALKQGRPHWFASFITEARLNPGQRYTARFFSTACADAFANDSYLLTIVESTLGAQEPVRLVTDQYATQAGAQYNPAGAATSARFGFMLRDYPVQVPISVIDEWTTQITAPAPHVATGITKAYAGDTIRLTGLSRNIGSLSDGSAGGEMWMRVIDLSTGLAPTGYTPSDRIITGASGLVASLAQNQEHTGNEWIIDFTMPNADINFRVETGHAKYPGTLSLVGGRLSGELVLDDWSPAEIRLRTV